MSISPLIMNFENFKGVKWTNPLMQSEMTVLVGRPPVSAGSIFAFLEFVSLEVWVLLLISLAMIFVTFILMDFKRYSRHKTSDLLQYAFHVWEISLLKPCTWKQHSIWIRILMPFSFWGIFFFMVRYTGDMTSSFFRTATPDFIRSIEDFHRFPDVTPMVLINSGEYSYLRGHPSPTYRAIFGRMNSNSSFIHYTDLYVDALKLADDVQTTNYALICLRSSIIQLLRQRKIIKTCNKRNYHITEPFSFVFIGLNLRVDIDPYILEKLNRRMLQMQQANLLEDKFHEDKRNHETCLDKLVQPDAQSLKLRELSGVFIIWFGGLLLATCVIFIERVWCFRALKIREIKLSD